MEVSGKKDPNNITFSHSEDSLYDCAGHPRKFERQKYLPKVRRIQALLGRSRDLRILDVGVGYGAFMKVLEEEGYFNLYGMDPFPESIAITSRHTSAVLKEGRIEDVKWPFTAGMFDVITCLDVLEHLENPGIFFQRCRENLKNEGVVIMSTPNRSVFYEMRSWPIVGIPDRNPTHINVNRPSYWIGLAKEEGYVILDKWLGEHISHLRYISYILNKLSEKLNLDLGKIPGIRQMEQAFCMVLRPVKDGNSDQV